MSYGVSYVAAASGIMLFSASSFLCLVSSSNKRERQAMETSLQVEELLKLPRDVTLPITRRDGKDYMCVRKVIMDEISRVMQRNSGVIPAGELEHLISFSRGVWAGATGITELLTLENRPYNERLGKPINPDHWYELNTANVNLFANLSLHNCPELLPGRLFTTRMPRDIQSNPTMAENFLQKVKDNNLKVVVILTEPFEYEKYAGSDLEAFYQSMKLKIIVRPIPDFSIPNKIELFDDVKDITYCLANNENVLVHCAGGNGRTGMIIASVFRNLGVNDPIAWIRRVKSTYVETQVQEDFVKSMPLTLNNKLCTEHPQLAKAIATEHLLDALNGATQHKEKYVQDDEKDVEDEALFDAVMQKGYNAAFDIFDADKSGSISMGEIRDVLVETGGAELDLELCLEKIRLASEEDGDTENLSREEFLHLMQSLVVSSVRHY